MKQIKKIILCIIIILIIVAGAVMVGLKGFNIELKDQDTQTMELYIKDKFNVDDIRQITNEVLGDAPVVIQKVEVYEESVLITAKEISDEQKENIINKVNEKYELEIKAEDITVKDVPHMRLIDIVKPYILPLIISTLIILVYIGIRYHKIGTIKSILKTGVIAIIAELILFALIAITRLPIGRYTLPLVLFVYLVTMIGITSHLEKRLKEKKLEEKEENIKQ